MATPYLDVQNSFHSKFQSKTIIDEDLERQFFLTALGDYELDLTPLSYDSITDEIDEDLSRSQINLLGLLMYKAYLSRERDRILKLNNIIGRDIKLTGMGNGKSSINKAYSELQNEIDGILTKLKDSSFYD